ncbi:hypothetical protein, partial [Staphylococcus aureus]|uniref:hypothetical protein n=1 Tax=Staphylococcus aureus TaxID=1280 RepID=UPI0038B290C7
TGIVGDSRSATIHSAAVQQAGCISLTIEFATGSTLPPGWKNTMSSFAAKTVMAIAVAAATIAPFNSASAGDWDRHDRRDAAL